MRVQVLVAVLSNFSLFDISGCRWLVGVSETRLFQHARGANPVPVISLVGKNTVQISLKSVGVEHCRRDRWGPLRIKYDIGPAEYPGVEARPHEC
jgi:hypothetical protein